VSDHGDDRRKTLTWLLRSTATTMPSWPPVTTAGSGPTELSRRRSRFESRRSPVKYLQICIYCCQVGRKRAPAYSHPAHIPHGNRPGIAVRRRPHPLIPAIETTGEETGGRRSLIDGRRRRQRGPSPRACSQCRSLRGGARTNRLIASNRSRGRASASGRAELQPGPPGPTSRAPGPS
jgi:hypothetical protein